MAAASTAPAAAQPQPSAPAWQPSDDTGAIRYPEIDAAGAPSQQLRTQPQRTGSRTRLGLPESQAVDNWEPQPDDDWEGVPPVAVVPSQGTRLVDDFGHVSCAQQAADMLASLQMPTAMQGLMETQPDCSAACLETVCHMRHVMQAQPANNGPAGPFAFVPEPVRWAAASLSGMLWSFSPWKEAQPAPEPASEEPAAPSWVSKAITHSLRCMSHCRVNPLPSWHVLRVVLM